MSPPAKLLLFAATFLAGAAGSASAGGDVDFHTAYPVIHGDTVYLTKEIHRQVWLPFSPEGPGWAAGASIYQVFAVDFGRENSFRSVSPRIKEDLWHEFRFVTFDAKGRPKIRKYSKLEAQLRELAGNRCYGSIGVDQQDSRVLYYQCRHEGLYWRFTETASFPQDAQPQAFKLPIELSSPGIPYYVIPFFSNGQDSKIYFRSPDDQFHELDLWQGEPRRIDAYQGLDRGPKYAPVHTIFGITSKQRLVTIQTEGPTFAFLALREGQPPRRYEFHDETLPVRLHSIGMKPIYLVDHDLVLWQIDEAKTSRTHVVGLRLGSGEIRRTSFLRQ